MLKEMREQDVSCKKGFFSTLRKKPLMEKCLIASITAAMAIGIAVAPARSSTLFSPGLSIQDTEKSMLSNPSDYSDFTRRIGSISTAKIGIEGYGIECLELHYGTANREDYRIESQRFKGAFPFLLLRLPGDGDTAREVREILETNPIRKIIGYVGVDMFLENYFFKAYSQGTNLNYDKCRQLNDFELNYGLSFVYDLFTNNDSLEQGVASKYLFSKVCLMTGLGRSNGGAHDRIMGFTDSISLSEQNIDEYTASIGLHLGIPAANIFGDRYWIDQWSPYSQFLSLSPYAQYTESLVDKASSVRLGMAVRIWLFELRAEETRRSDGTQERVSSFAIIGYEDW